ncbi:uncharacterized protein V6R79_005743 [Siganus canaliculatus]
MRQVCSGSVSAFIPSLPGSTTWDFQATYSYPFCDNVRTGLHHSALDDDDDFQDNRPAVNKLHRKRKSKEKAGQSSKRPMERDSVRSPESSDLPRRPCLKTCQRCISR